VVIGDRTFGKPVGQYGFNFCDKVLAPVAFSLVNADGRGDYFGGIDPTCAAADDVSRDLGAGDEASLAEALHYVRTGSCSRPSLTTRLRRPAERQPPPLVGGWETLVNAH
jgi:hypothetical protein